MYKNLTPRQVALYASVIISALAALYIFLTRVFLVNANHILVSFSTFLILFIPSYFLLNYLIRRYIYRRIKLIYKVIHEDKISSIRSKQVTQDHSSELFETITKDVEEWGEEQQKMIESLKALEIYRREFVGNVSHELKTPLFNIQGYVHTLLDGAMDEPGLNRKYLERASKNIDRLQTIIYDLDLISKYEQSDLVLDRSKFEIHKLVEEVFEELELLADERGIDLVFKDGLKENINVLADREAIRQVLINLVGNAIKYGKDSGVVKVGIYTMDANILVEIADNGIGIDKEHHKHLFNRFYRVDKSRSRDVGGSGLGLAIAKHIVEAHGHTINVRSTPDVGSTFVFTLDNAGWKK